MHNTTVGRHHATNFANDNHSFSNNKSCYKCDADADTSGGSIKRNDEPDRYAHHCERDTN